MGLLEVIAVNWVYGLNRFTSDIEFMLGRKTGYYWKFCWVCLIPCILAAIFLYTLSSFGPPSVGEYKFGPGANGKIIMQLNV